VPSTAATAVLSSGELPLGLDRRANLSFQADERPNVTVAAPRLPRSLDLLRAKRLA
jgi:hypothetical protein